VLTALTALGDRELAAIADLERRVVAADGGRLKLEYTVLRNRNRNRNGRRVTDFLWHEAGTLVGFCGLYAFGPEVEIGGMIDPAWRRRGIGTALLRAALPLATDDDRTAALLVTPRTTPAGRAFAVHHHGTLDHSEHFLVLEGTPTAPSRHADVVIRDAVRADAAELARILAVAFGDDPREFTLVLDDQTQRQLVLERAGTVIGAIRVSGDAEGMGVYGFAIEPSLQGHGIGRSVLARVCADLRAAGVPHVTIEVAVDNDNALGLYASLGFRQRATEDYFAVRRTPA
jgi:ribosomal protein S18 acetylase RimI-like enzyme